MCICDEYGKLYAFFLKFCLVFVGEELHERMKVPRNCQQMYNHLDRQLSFWFSEPYEDIINGLNLLSKKEKKILTPRDKRLEAGELDFSIYLKIIKILGGAAPKGLLNYIVRLRNYLCHVPVVELQNNLDAAAFEHELLSIRQNLESWGIDKGLLDDCEISCFGRIRSR